MQSFILAAALMGAAVSASVIPRQGTTFTIPTYGGDIKLTVTDLPATNGTANICGAGSFVNHTVVDGDTLTTLAEQYSSGICDIAAASGLANPNLIELGQTLSIPLNCTTPDNTTCIDIPAEPTWTCVPGPPSTYDVRANDTLTTIATSFNITLDALVAANTQIENIDLIFPLQIINIPVCPSSQCTVQTYEIRQGDIFYDLASAYGTTTGQILALNVGVDPEALVEGQQIILPWGCQNVTVAVA